MNHSDARCVTPWENISAYTEVSTDSLLTFREKRRGEGNTLPLHYALEATVDDRHTHANTLLAFVLCFFTNCATKQNGTRNSVLGEIKLLD